MLCKALAFLLGVWAAAILVTVTVAVPVLANDDYDDEDEGESEIYVPKGPFIEPDVRRYTSVLPREVCQKLIDLGESTGFALDVDSIDKDEKYYGFNTQAIDVMKNEGEILAPEIFEVLKPYIPSIAELVRDQRNPVLHRMLFPDEPSDRLPKLGWVFYRKYAPQSARNSLAPHSDVNFHTVNIALNDDFTGGGIFYIKPTFELNPDWDYNQEENFFFGEEGEGVPDLGEGFYTQEWVNNLNATNTTSVVFPKLEEGDALIHNYTVWHAVAPIKTGIRYSMVLFFDEDNPLMQEDDYDDDVGYEALTMNIFLSHKIRECDSTTGNLVYIKDSIDVYWVDHMNQSNEVGTFNMRPGTIGHELTTYAGHTFRAFRSIPNGEVSPPLETREVLAMIVVEQGKTIYDIVGSVTSQADCDTDTVNRVQQDEL